MRLASTFAAVLLSVFAAGHARAAQSWTWFAVSGGAVAFDELSRQTDVVTGVVAANTVTYYQQPHDGAGGAYSFLAERLEFECRGNHYQWSNSAAYQKSGAFVSQREDSGWLDLGPELGSTALYRRMLCNTETPPNVSHAGDIDALFKAMTNPAPTPTPTVAAAPLAPLAAPPKAVAATAVTSPAPAVAPVKSPAVAAAPRGKPADVAKPAPKGLDMDALAASLANSAASAASPPTPGLRP